MTAFRMRTIVQLLAALSTAAGHSGMFIPMARKYVMLVLTLLVVLLLVVAALRRRASRVDPRSASRCRRRRYRCCLRR